MRRGLTAAWFHAGGRQAIPFSCEKKILGHAEETPCSLEANLARESIHRLEAIMIRKTCRCGQPFVVLSGETHTKCYKCREAK